MRCRDVRARLVEGPGPTGAELARHVDQCAGCADFAARMEAVRGALRRHHAGVEPGPELAARVMQRLPGTPELLGWAALRLLPAALALALGLSWYGLTRGPGLSDLLLRPEDPLLLTYVALPEPER